MILVILMMTAPVGDLGAQPPQAGDLVVVRNSGLGVPSCLFTLNPGTGIWTTLSTTPSSQSYYISCVRMAPNSRDLLITGGPNIPSQYLEQVDSKTGARTTLATFPRSVEGFNLDHDNTLIAAGYTAAVSPGTSHLWSLKYVTPSSLTLSTLASYPAGTNYHAFNRRPPAPATCVRFASGEYLLLDYTDPLFLTTVLNLAPHVFQNFQGMTNASAAATATVNVRNRNLNLTIFVAGVILNPAGPTVTNTHWFVL
jgi:hypothetical protein